MRIEQVIKDEGAGSWTNDTGLPVELNPPGIVVAPGQSVERDESGTVHLGPTPEEKKPAEGEAKPEAKGVHAEGAGSHEDSSHFIKPDPSDKTGEKRSKHDR